MKIRLLSDMHIEFRKNKLKIPELPTDKETVLILAGDIGVGTGAVNPIIKIAPRFKQVLYIAGNHEYYDNNVTVLRHYLRTKAFEYTDNVEFLDNNTHTIDDITFYGGTMWTDMAVHDPDMALIRWRIAQGMTDFHSIKHRNADIAWTPQDCYFEYQNFTGYLAKAVYECKERKEKMFVITHHAPSSASVGNDYKRNTLNAAYHGEQDEFITEHDDIIKWWVHGHMHHTVDYNIGDTRIFSNPYGYHNYETNKDHEVNKVWEIE